MRRHAPPRTWIRTQNGTGSLAIHDRSFRQPAVFDMRPAHGRGALRIVALRDSRRPGLVATSGQTRWPPAVLRRPLTLTLNTAGPLTGASSRRRETASPARLT